MGAHLFYVSMRLSQVDDAKGCLHRDANRVVWPPTPEGEHSLDA